MKFRVLRTILEFALVMGAFTGLMLSCTARTAEKDSIQFLVGVSQANLSEPWRIVMTQEIKETALNYPNMRIVLTDASDRPERQIEDVNRLVALGIDLLIVSPVDASSLTPVVSSIHKKLPVIVLDRGVEGYDYTVYIGPDNNQIGRQAGQYIRSVLGPTGGSVVEIRGRAGSPPAEGRSSGFKEELEKARNIVTVDSIVADWLRDRAEDELTKRLAKYPPIHAVFAQNDAMALGARRALMIAHRQNTIVIGVDGLPGPAGGLELVRDNALAATFICPTGGREAVVTAMDILNKEDGIPKKIILRSRLVTQQNIETVLTSTPLRIDGRRIKLGFSQPGRESDWRIANIESIEDAAKKADIELYMENAYMDQTKQIEAIRSFIAKKVDIIAFSPLVETGWDEVLEEAREAGIPVICSDRTVRTIDDSLFTTYIGADFIEEGRRAARWLAEHTAGRERVNIVEIAGTLDSAPMNGRQKGFKEIADTIPSFHIVESVSGDFRKDEGHRVMAQVLARRAAEIDVVYAHNDDMGLGAIQAIEEFGLVPGKDIEVISIDGVKEAFKAMIAGRLACTIECNPLLGPQLMKIVKDYAEGRPLPLRIITEEGVYPAETAAKNLPMRKY